MPFRTLLAKTHEWIFRSDALARARAGLKLPDDQQERAARQARLLVEVAREAANPREPLPQGSRPALLLSLYRDAVHWALIARPNPSAPGADVATADALAPTPLPLSLDATDDQATRARALAERLVWELDAPRRQVARIRMRRWAHGLIAGAVAVLLAVGIDRLTRSPNLAFGRPLKTSSTYDCTNDEPCQKLMFCTNNELNPWAEFDLGAERSVSRVELTNREDCCADRAVPLTVAVSTDRATWTEVARRDTEFSTFTATFPTKRARYVRLVVHKTTNFHLGRVAIR
jgi:hypothetical protein